MDIVVLNVVLILGEMPNFSQRKALGSSKVRAQHPHGLLKQSLMGARCADGHGLRRCKVASCNSAAA